VEFQALLTEIAAQKPDVVFAFFAGGGAVKFVKDYDAAGLRRACRCSARLPDRRHAGGAGACGQGLQTTLHYADTWTRRAQRLPQELPITYKQTPTCTRCRLRRRADPRGRAERGEGRHQQACCADGGDAQGHGGQPRGKFTISPAGNPVQDMYLREARASTTSTARWR